MAGAGLRAGFDGEGRGGYMYGPDWRWMKSANYDLLFPVVTSLQGDLQLRWSTSSTFSLPRMTVSWLNAGCVRDNFSLGTFTY